MGLLGIIGIFALVILVGAMLGWALHHVFARAINEVKTRSLLADAEKHLVETNKSSFEAVVRPLCVQLDNLTKDVKESSRSQIDLKGQLQQMNEIYRQSSQQTENLTKALKGDPQTRGKWGEMLLERALERSGLRKDEEYRLQPSYTDEETGKRYRPDAEILLPDQRVVFIDAKTSLLDYERYTNSEEATEKEGALRDFLQSVKLRVKELGEKNYARLGETKNFDYVLMFVPIESAFSLASEHDKSLFDYAWERKILIASPTTLLCALSTIYYTWRAEKQNKNAEEIAQEGGRLYDKVVNFLEDMRKHGEQLQTARKSYDGAMNKLSEGHGSILDRTKKLGTLGVKNTKTLKHHLTEEE